MKKRIYGIETEYGLLIKGDDFKYGSVDVAVRLKNHIFEKGMGVLDLHYRANDEPPGNGGFLVNGGRIMVSAHGEREIFVPRDNCHPLPEGHGIAARELAAVVAPLLAE